MRVGLDKQGMVMAFVAISLLMFLALVALVVDLGHGLSVKTQLQEVADAAALASASHFDGTLAGVDAARAEAIAYAAKNKANGYPVALLPGDIEFGYWDMPTKVFSPILPGNLGYPEDINAVRVTARRDTASGTALSTTFAKTFGRDTMDVSAQAVAQKGGPSRCVDSDDPTLDCNLIPVTLCKNKITTIDGAPNCDVPITVGSTPTQSGALTSFFETASDVNIKNYANGTADGTTDTPTLYARPCSQCPLGLSASDQTGIEASWGTQPGVFAALRNTYAKAIAPCVNTGSGPNCEGSGEPPEPPWFWKAYVAVMCADCDAPSGASGPVCVTGFATIDIEEVCTSQGQTSCVHTGEVLPSKKSTTNAIFGHLKCGGDAPPSSGTGGADFGTDSPIPGLVQ
jgi:Putative Tad-like Flp pilus-assembly